MSEGGGRDVRDGGTEGLRDEEIEGRKTEERGRRNLKTQLLKEVFKPNSTLKSVTFTSGLTACFCFTSSTMP
jgi:hypothetical protein